jgi:hypothetical protein
VETHERTQSLFAPPEAPPQETCVTCGEPIATPFCPHCGERRASDRKHGVWDFIRDHVIEAFASFDGRIIRTLKALVLAPGKLTVEFMRGSRIPYVAPLQFFLMLNVVYFVWSAKSGDRMFETQLGVQVQQPIYGPVARRLVDAELVASGDTSKAAAKQYAREFDRLESTQARSLLVAMAPIFAVFVGAATLGRRRRPIVQHVVFALHALSFLLVFEMVSRYVIQLPLVTLLARLHVETGPYGYDDQISLVMLALLTTYLALALRRAYGLSKVRSGVSGFAAAFGLFLTITTYRALLFFVTFYSR